MPRSASTPVAVEFLAVNRRISQPVEQTGVWSVQRMQFAVRMRARQVYATVKPASPNRVTLRDIARKAGVHFSTVSLALRDHPRIPAETRERLRQLARKLGYVADPLLASLSSYRSKRRGEQFRSSLAWITNYPTAHGWKQADLFH